MRELADEVEAALGLAPPEPVTVVLALTDGGYERAVRELAGGGPGPPDWSLAAAIPGRNAVAIRASRLRLLTWADLRPTLAHELAHLALGPVRAEIPRWLNEGLAMYAEGRRLAPEERTRLQREARLGTLPELAALESGFPEHAALAETSYLYSLAFVRALEERGGPESIRDLVRRLDEGLPLDRAFLRTYDSPIEGFDSGFRGRLARRYSLVRDFSEQATIVTFLAVLAAFAGIIVVLRRRRAIRRMDDAPEPPAPTPPTPPTNLRPPPNVEG